jgi:outer membrane protein insertion porin family
LFLGVFGIGTARSQEASDARPVLEVEGNKVFSKQELLDVANTCLDRNTEAGKPFETARLDYCLYQLTDHMRAKGYLQARLGKTLYNQTEGVSKATIPVEEGPLYRVGEIKIENTKLFSPAQIQDLIGLRPGDIADGAKLGTALYERAKEAYGNFGYIQYTAEITPTFRVKEGADEGVADFVILINEGQQFKIRSIKFAGGDNKTNELLRRELMVRDGDVYNSDLLAKSITRMNNTGLYDRIDANKDVDFQTNEKAASIDLTIKLRKRTASAESQD